MQIWAQMEHSAPQTSRWSRVVPEGDIEEDK